ETGNDDNGEEEKSDDEDQLQEDNDPPFQGPVNSRSHGTGCAARRTIGVGKGKRKYLEGESGVEEVLATKKKCHHTDQADKTSYNLVEYLPAPTINKDLPPLPSNDDPLPATGADQKKKKKKKKPLPKDIHETVKVTYYENDSNGVIHRRALKLKIELACRNFFKKAQPAPLSHLFDCVDHTKQDDSDMECSDENPHPTTGPSKVQANNAEEKKLQPGFVFPQDFFSAWMTNGKINRNKQKRKQLVEQYLVKHVCLILPRRLPSEFETEAKDTGLTAEEMKERFDDIDVYVKHEVHGPEIQLRITGELNSAWPQFLKKIMADKMAGPYLGQHGFHLGSSQWNLFATAASFSRGHYDAGKFCTWIRVLSGLKIWIVFISKLPEENLMDLDVDKLSKYGQLFYFVLKDSLVLNMPPGVPHWVLSVTQCLAEGGHYYLKACFYKSFLIGLQQHCLEDMETNTSHFGDFILDEQEPESMDTAAFENMVKGWPDPLNALLAMTVHAVAFEPAQMKDSAAYDCP
ncbi:hypothetical protein M422DRAFT_272524, partial [Sphaerobolus stellatus SS14]